MRLAFLIAMFGIFAIAPFTMTGSRRVPPRWRMIGSFLSLSGMGLSAVAILGTLAMPEALSATDPRDALGPSSVVHASAPWDHSWPAALVLAVFLSRFGFALVRTMVATRRARPTGGPGATTSGGVPIHVLPIGDAEAYSVGPVRPAIVATEGLRHALDPAEWDAVLDHEEAHARGRHHLLLLFARATSEALWPLPSARRALTDLRQCLEESADGFAARRSGADNLALGIAKVARLRVSPTAGVGASGGSVAQRIERILDPPNTPRWVSPAAAAVTVPAISCVIVAQAIVALVVLFAGHHLGDLISAL